MEDVDIDVHVRALDNWLDSHGFLRVLAHARWESDRRLMLEYIPEAAINN